MPALSTAIPSDIETLVRTLASRLADYPPPANESEYPAGDGQVLLDVELGDIRLLAVRSVHPTPASLLSPREREIARMVAAGLPNKAIASILEISCWTVASHLRRIFIKLEVSSRAAMAARLSAQAFGNPVPSQPPGRRDHTRSVASDADVVPVAAARRDQQVRW
jgi:DNA-binding CsgD family transcriptional regulator